MVLKAHPDNVNVWLWGILDEWFAWHSETWCSKLDQVYRDLQYLGKIWRFSQEWTCRQGRCEFTFASQRIHFIPQNTSTHCRCAKSQGKGCQVSPHYWATLDIRNPPAPLQGPPNPFNVPAVPWALPLGWGSGWAVHRGDLALPKPCRNVWIWVSAVTRDHSLLSLSP